MGAISGRRKMSGKFRKAANVFFAAILALGLVPAGAGTHAEQAYADTGWTSITHTGNEWYDGYGTGYFRADGQVAWCSQPNLGTPDGSFSYSTDIGSESTGAAAYCIAMLYADSTMMWSDDPTAFGWTKTSWDNNPVEYGVGTYLDGILDSYNSEDSRYVRFHVMLSYCANRAWPGWCDPFRGCTNRPVWEAQSSAMWDACYTIASGGTVPGASQEECARLRAVAQTTKVAFTNSGSEQSITWLAEVGKGTGAIDLSKRSSEPSISDGNAMYGLSGARYGVYASWNAANGRSGEAWTMTTDSDGYAYQDGIAPGTYYVRETFAPDGYMIDDSIYEVEVYGGQTTRVNGGTVQDVVASLTGGPTLAKFDSEGALSPAGNKPQGDGSLALAEYTIKYYAANDASGTPKRTWVLRADANGQIDLSKGESSFKYNGNTYAYKVSGDDFYKVRGAIVLPVGTVTVQETKAPEGYKLPSPAFTATGHIKKGSKSIIWDNGKTYADKESGQIEQTFGEDVIRCGIAIDKSDIETGTGAPLGGASIDGAVFEVVNQSANPVRVGGVLYAKGQTVATLTVKDGVATTDSDGDGTDRTLPFGTYTVREASAGEGYNVSADVCTINASEFTTDGKVVKKTRDDKSGIENQVKRGDFELIKASSVDGSRLGSVAFLITSDTTGESHVAVTDANGQFSTAASKHSDKTNANDKALSTDADGEQSVDSSKLDDEAGIWFGSADGKMVEANDSMGALPYDTYTIDELRCDGNAGLQLLHGIKLSISKDKTTVSLGTIDDTKPSLSTTAYCGELTSKSFVADTDAVTITDRVAYAGAVPGSAYTVRGAVYDKSTGAPLLIGGKPVAAEKTFTPDQAFGQVELEFTLPDTSALEDGAKIVVCEDLYQGREKVAYHHDLTDAEQTLSVTRPAIGTTAADGESSTHDTVRDTEMSIVDTVSYKNCIPGREYAVTGKLYDKATGEPALDATGDEITATAAFTPEEPEGTAEVTFEFDGSNLDEGQELVAFESLLRSGSEMASHADIDDAAQTVLVHVPGVATTATDAASGSKNVVADPESGIVDAVQLTGLVKGRAYTLHAELMTVDADGNAEPFQVGGTPVSNDVEFTAEEVNMTVDVPLSFDSSAVPEGGKLVCFETLLRGDATIADHKEPLDEGQTVTVLHPIVGTLAVDGIDSDKVVAADTETSIVDTVYYSGVVPGREYTVTGTLIVKSTFDDGATMGEPLLRDGEPVTATATFTPEEESGTVEVHFEFYGVDLPAGTELVAYEDLLRVGAVVASHADIDDESQTVSVAQPKIRTTATDEVDGDKQVVCDPESKVVDEISYINLAAGKPYTLRGELRTVGADGAAGDVVAEAAKEFIPEASNGTEGIEFDLSTVDLAGKKVVAYEYLYRGDVKICEHAAADDEDQTVEVVRPEIATRAADVVDGDQSAVADKAASIDDHVELKNVVPGKEYKLVATATLLKPVYAEDGTVSGYEDAGEMADAAGKVYTGETTFMPGAADCEQTVRISVDANGLEGCKIVVNERLYRGDDVVAEHKDASDADQTVDVTTTQIHTTATDPADGDHEVDADSETTIVDTVSYENAVPGVEHHVYGILFDKATFAPVVAGADDDSAATLEQQAQELSAELAATLLGKDASQPDGDKATDGGAAGADSASTYGSLAQLWGRSFSTKALDVDVLKQAIAAEYPELASHLVVAEATFTPDEANGTQDVTFSFDGSRYFETSGAELVAFELLVRDGQAAAVHADIADEGQTVMVVPPEIGTELVDATDGDHSVQRSETAELTDNVSYTGLVPGKTYHLTGTLMDKETGEPVDNGGQPLTAEADFTPEESDGTATVTFALDTSALYGKQLVAFESLTKDGKEVAVHADLADESQTVTVDDKPPVIDETYDQTGADARWALAGAGALGIAGAAALGIAAWRRRRAQLADNGAPKL